MRGSCDKSRLADPIRSLLGRLRWQIRAYIWLEGLALVFLWIGLTFWLTLAVDYLPVLLAGSELSWQARAVLLLLVVGVLGLVLYRWVVRRTLVPMADPSMALLLERRYGQFRDSLVTSVEMAERPEHAESFNPEMLHQTHQEALAQTAGVQLRRIFNFSPLMLSVSGASLLALTIGWFAWFFPGAFLLGASRIYLLDDAPWPRRARIEVVGIEVPRRAPAAAGTYRSKRIPFTDGTVKVAKGSSVVLKVRADARGPQRVVPKTCAIIYRTDDGDRGRRNMKRVGRIRDGFQWYSFDGKPLKGILSTVRFDVVGFDDRVRNLAVQIVDNPSVVATELDCVFPDYMVDLQSTAWTPRTIAWTSGTQLPRGTKVTVRARANKPLRRAYVHYPDTGRTETIEVTAGDRRRFAFPLPPLDQNLSLEITLHDTDDVIGQSPQRLYITAVPDQSPDVQVALRGIGLAVTPEARVPIEGTITDDYGVARAWIDVQPTGLDLYEQEVALSKSGKVAAAVDFRALRDAPQHGFTLTPGKDNKLVLTVKAADRYDLADEPHIGSGDRFELDIVTPDELLAILEREEAGLRRRVEQIHEEMTEARDYLLRVKAEGLADGDLGFEPEDRASQRRERPSSAGAPQQEAAGREAARLHALRSLYAQRALLQTRKSAQEVLGVAAAFRDIREQLINNRIDAEDRKSRLQNEIADPLQQIGQRLFADLESQLVVLDGKLRAMEKNLDDQEARAAVSDAAGTAVAQTDHLLAELEKVLDRLIKFETYAELLDIVRDLIKDQEGLIEATRKQQRKDVLQGLVN